MCWAACRCRDCKLYLSSNQSAITEDQGQGLWEQCVLGSVSQSGQWEVILVTSGPSDWLKHNIVDIAAVVQAQLSHFGWKISAWLEVSGEHTTSVSINTQSRLVRPRHGAALPVSQQPVSWLTSHCQTSSCSLFLCELWTESGNTQRATQSEGEWRKRVTSGRQGTWLSPWSRRLNGMFSVQCWGCQFSRASWHYTVTLADCYELSLPNITLIKAGRYQDKKNSLYWNTQTSN